MPQLASPDAFSRINFSIQDNTTANTCSQSNHNHILTILARTCSGFAQSGTVSVVGNLHRYGKIIANGFYQLHIFPANIIRISHHPVFAVNRSRNTNSCTYALLYGNSLFFQ